MKYHLINKITFLILIAVFPLSAFAKSFDDYTIRQVSQCTKLEGNNNVSVTDTNTKFTFTRDTKALYIENLGDTNEMWVDINDGVATAEITDIKLEAGENRVFSGFKTREVGIIASSGETTTAKIEGCF